MANTFDKKHFKNKTIKPVFTLFQNAEVLAGILWNQTMAVAKMLADWKGGVFMQMKTWNQHNLHCTDHIQIFKQDIAGSQSVA